MKLRDITICIICVVIAAGLFWTAGTRLDYINTQRKEMKLISNEPLENAPPSLAFATVAMGAFRGLVVDILWIRADALKEKGQFFDAKQLADWITVLQPRFASVWEFQAWNMAYNISVAIPASQPAERWRWVRNGYELIRDKGIVINPHSIKLYRQLAWIFQHKIGGVTDDAHRYYKLQIALSMQNILGKDPSNDFFDKLVAIPKDIEQILNDAEISDFVSRLQAADKSFSDAEKICSNYLAVRAGPANFDPNVFSVVDEFRNRNKKAFEKFDIFARSYQLGKVWKLDPELMARCNQLYGPIVGDDPNDPNNRLPLNWQHPNAHAIYWAEKGMEIAGGNPQSIDELNADRIIFHGLQDLYRSGRIFIHDEPVEITTRELKDNVPVKVKTVRKSIFLRPDLRMFDTYNTVMLQRIEKYSSLPGARPDSILGGHRNMLKNAVLSFYQAGQEDKAREIYNLLRKLYGKERKELRVSLIDFCRARIKEELESVGITDVREIVVLMLREAYFRYAVGDDEQAFGREQMAREIYDKYQKEFADETEQGISRVTLPSYAKLHFVSLVDFMSDAYYPQQFKDLLVNRIKVERPKLYKQLEQQSDIFQKQLEQQQNP